MNTAFRVGEKNWREIQILSYLYEVMTIMDFFLNVFMGVLGVVGCGGLVNRIIIIDHSRPFIGIISNSCNRTSGGSCRFSIFLLDGAEQGPLTDPSPIGVAPWGVPLLGLHKLFIIFSFQIRVIYYGVLTTLWVCSTKNESLGSQQDLKPNYFQKQRSLSSFLLANVHIKKIFVIIVQQI